MNLKLPSTENSRADFHEVLSGIQITTFPPPPPGEDQNKKKPMRYLLYCVSFKKKPQ